MTIEQYPSSNNIATTTVWKYTATGSELTLSGYDNYSQALQFTAGSEQVYLNGVLLVRNLDYTPAANGLSITFPTQLSYNDFVQIYCYSNYSIASVASSSITGTIQNAQLSNSSITFGNQTISLGGTLTTPTGLSISGSTNTLTNIPNSALSNSSIIINGNPISLGGTVNITTPNNILANKGGLIVGTGGGSVAQLTIGADGTIPFADSTQTTGINWSGPHNIAGKNLITNGGFDSWSLGTTFTADLSWTADKWFARIVGAQSITQETSDLPTTNTRYGLKWNTTASSSGFSQIHYPLNSATTIGLRGKTVTFSFYAKVSGGYAGNIGPEVKYSNSQVDAGYINGATSVVISSGGFAAPTTWTRLSYTLTVPSDAVSIYFGIVPDTAQSIAGQTVRIANVQLEIGSSATPFTKAFSTPNADVSASGPSGFDGILASSTVYNSSGYGTPSNIGWAGYNVAGKNFIRNGNMEIAQRGASLNGPNGYSLDGWYVSGYGTSNNLSINQYLVSAYIPGSRYYMRIGATSSSNQNYFVSQSIATDEVIRFAGQWVTLSFYYRSAVNMTNPWSINTMYNTTNIDGNLHIGTGVSATNITSDTLSNANGTWQKYTKTLFVPANSTSFGIMFSSVNSTVSNAIFDITQVQLEIGTTATQFSRSGGTYQGEVSLCERYYWRTTAARLVAIMVYGTNSIYGLIRFPTTMRVAPIIGTSGVASHFTAYIAGTPYSGTSVPALDAASTPDTYHFGMSISGGTAGQAGVMGITNAAGYLEWSAEL